MKLLSLDLLAYGHFKDHRLSFPDGGPSLHLIHGPNEAGKSTTLRAITGFLYGIEKNTTDAHRFEGSELRIGATVRHSTLGERYFVRRKGTAGTLLDGDGKALDEAELTNWLSVRDRRQFEAMFGLSHELLRKAGDALASSKNAVAEALFGAVLEGASLHGTMSRLQDEASALLSSTGRAGDLAKAIKTYRELRDVERKSEASAGKHKQLKDELEAAQASAKRLEEQLHALRVEMARKERVRKTLPWLLRRSIAIADRAALGEVRQLAEDTAQRRRDLLRERDETELAAGEIAAKLERTRREREEIDASDALVAFAPRVRALSEQLGTYKKGLVDRPGLVHEILPHRRDAEEILRELGRAGLSLDEIEALRLTTAEQERIRALQRQGVSLSSEKAAVAKQLAEARAELASRRGALEALAPCPDVSALQAIWGRSDAVLHFENELPQAQQSAGDLARRLDELALSLGLQGAGRAAIAALLVPSAEAISRAERAEAESATRSTVTDSNRKQILREREGALRDLAKLEAGGPIPTLDALRAARTARDERWQAVVRAWRINASIDDAAPLIGAFEAALREGDLLADALRTDVARVELRDQLGRALAQIDARLREVDEERAANALSDAERTAAWRASWAAIGVAPSTPREMATWRSGWEALVLLSRKLEEAQDRLEQLGLRGASLRQALMHALSGTGAILPDGLPWLALRASVEQTLAQAEASRLKRASLSQEVDRLASTVAKVEGALAHLEAQTSVWKHAWAEASAKLRVDGAAPVDPDAAPRLLDRLSDLFKAAERRDRLEKRIKAIDKDLERFERALSEQLGQLGLELDGSPLVRAETLIERVTSAVSAAERRAALGEQVARLEAELDAARVRQERATLSLERLLEETGSTSVDELEAAELRSAAARAHDRAREDAEQRLSELGEGWSLAELEAAAAGTDSDTLLADLAGLEAELLQKTQASSEALKAVGEIGERLRSYSAGDDAARRLEEAESQAETARSLAARYARLHLGAKVLQRAMARYQDEHQGQILRRAEELFRKLTRGRYQRLHVEYESDGASIQCVRGGEPVQVRERVMSDGTLDQLYLALRLASIEQHLASQEPMPLVLDDIFIHFDDDRAQAGIEVLAEFAQKTQVLLLTHHARTLELARRALPERSWNEIHLARREAPLGSLASGARGLGGLSAGPRAATVAGRDGVLQGSNEEARTHPARRRSRRPTAAGQQAQHDPGAHRRPVRSSRLPEPRRRTQARDDLHHRPLSARALVEAARETRKLWATAEEQALFARAFGRLEAGDSLESVLEAERQALAHESAMAVVSRRPSAVLDKASAAQLTELLIWLGRWWRWFSPAFWRARAMAREAAVRLFPDRAHGAVDAALARELLATAQAAKVLSALDAALDRVGLGHLSPRAPSEAMPLAQRLSSVVRALAPVASSRAHLQQLGLWPDEPSVEGLSRWDTRLDAALSALEASGRHEAALQPRREAFPWLDLAAEAEQVAELCDAFSRDGERLARADQRLASARAAFADAVPLLASLARTIPSGSSDAFRRAVVASWAKGALSIEEASCPELASLGRAPSLGELPALEQRLGEASDEARDAERKRVLRRLDEAEIVRAPSPRRAGGAPTPKGRARRC